MPTRSPHRPAFVTLAAAAVLVGLVLSRVGWLAVWNTGWLFALITLLLWRTRLWWVGLAVLCLGLGLYRGQSFIAGKALLAGNMDRSVTVVGKVADDPVINDRRQQDFRMSGLSIEGRPVNGRIRIKRQPVRLQRGMRVAVTGTLKPGFATWDAALYFPRLTVLNAEQSWLERQRQRFFAGMRTALPEPNASFGLGLLVGVRSLIPPDLQTALTRIGLSHLVAVSGYNLTIIVRLITRLLGGLGRNVGLVLSLWLIGAFVIVSGASASIVWAGVVSIVSLVALRYGRRIDPLSLVGLVAAATALWNPDYLINLGWLLSFLAFFGILVLAPQIERRIGHDLPAVARMSIETLVAELMTLPLILSVFGHLSIIAPLANLVIAPFIPFAMLFSAIAGFAGMLVPAWSGFVAWPADLLVGTMLKGVAGMAAVPWAATDRGLSTTAMLAWYAVIVVLTAALAYANRNRPLPDPDATGSRLL